MNEQKKNADQDQAVAPDISGDIVRPQASLSLALPPAEDVPHGTSARPPARRLDAQEARDAGVRAALDPAYEKASELKLSQEEMEGLRAPFPDEAIEIRPHDGLIYIPHIYISERLNRVLGQGQWSMVRRREFQEGNRIYAEWVLKVRGCFVGESIGAQDYVPSNPKTNYSDALEGTRGECIRRIAGKDLSCGHDVWKPSYARAWVAKHAVAVWCKNAKTGRKEKKWRRREDPPIDMWPFEEVGVAQSAQDAPVRRPEPQRAPAPRPEPQNASEGDFDAIEPPGGWQGAAGGDPTDGWPDEVPEGGEAEQPKLVQNEKTWPWWKDVTLPRRFKKHGGMKLGDLPKGNLRWYCYNVAPTPHPKTGELSEDDVTLRKALDAALDHYNFDPYE